MKNLFSLRSSLSVVTVVITSLVFSCKDKTSDYVTPTDNNVDKNTYERILATGFKENTIVDLGNYYLVEGDIRFWKSQSTSGNGRQRAVTQYKLPNLSVVGSITIRVDNSFSSSTFRNNVISAVQTACNRWNGINSAVKFTYTTGSSANITVNYDSSLPSSAYGAGDYSNTGNPDICDVGHTLSISSNAANLSSSQLAFVVTHEMGHTIGFAHTDQGAGSYQIFGSPISDSNSIMQSGPADGITGSPSSVPSRSAFTNGDQNATKFLFPSGGPTVTPVYDSQGDPSNPVRVTWTPSYFCSLSIDVEIYDGDTFVKSLTQTFNDGIQTFSTNQLTSGRTYTFIVHPHGDTNNQLSSDVQINFP